MKVILNILVLGILVNQTLGACTVPAGPNGKCCESAAGAQTKGPGVKDCVTASNADADVNAATCLIGFYLNTDVCTPCAAGTTTTDGNSDASCTNCSVNFFCPLASYATAATSNNISCPAGYYCPAQSSIPTPCPTGQYSSASQGAASDCTPISGTAIVGCNSYALADVSTGCASAAEGYTQAADYGLTTLANFGACVAGCQYCTVKLDKTACTVVLPGYGYDTTTTAGKSIVVPCSSDKSRGVCTWDTTKKIPVCTGASAGYSFNTTSTIATICPTGKGNAFGNILATCTSCTASSNCQSCTELSFCTSCLPGYLLDPTKGTCTLFEGKAHVTCLKADSIAEDHCMSCDDTTQKRTMELEAPVAPSTEGVPKVVGQCVCQTGYGDQRLSSTPSNNCASCGDNVASCTFSSTDTKSEFTCVAGFYKAGQGCFSSSMIGVIGFYWDTSLATSAFKACNPTWKCSTCNAAGCLKCPEAPSNWVEPTAASANYATYIKGTRALINGQCYDDCPAKYDRNPNKSGCILANVNINSSKTLTLFVLILAFIIF